jgi:hypothetical protein
MARAPAGVLTEGVLMRNNKIRWRRMLTTGAASALLIATGAAHAEGPNLLDKGFDVSLGTFIVNQNTEVRLDGKTSGEVIPGTPIDWERNFGDGDSTRFRLDSYWRFAERHKLRLMWFNASRSGSKTIDRTIDWQDQEFQIGATVKGESKFNIVELGYDYAFMRGDNYELSGTAGIHYTDFSVSLSGEATDLSNPELTVTRHVKKEGSVGLPLPVFGGHYLWRMGGDFWLDASAQWFGLTIDQYSGSIWDLKLDALWQPSKWVGLGVGYDRFKIDVNANTDKFNGKLNWEYSGPRIFYAIHF